MHNGADIRPFKLDCHSQNLLEVLSFRRAQYPGIIVRKQKMLTAILCWKNANCKAPEKNVFSCDAELIAAISAVYLELAEMSCATIRALPLLCD
eukprot:scaffold222318_cov17-Prasinocladus_malaysianus.AAC.1